MKRIVTIAFIMIGVVAVLFAGMYFFKKMRTDYIKKEKAEAIHVGMMQLEELKKLGFTDADSRVKTIQNRIACAQEELALLDPSVALARKQNLERLIAQTKDMIHAYRQQLQTLRDLKVKHTDTMIS